MTDQTRYDRDPEALAWARAKVREYIDRLADFEQQAKADSSGITAYGCGVARLLAERHFLGDGGCTIGVFDERRPGMAPASSAERAPAADRGAVEAVRKLHHPASDWSWKPLGCQHDGAHSAPCRGCHGECWPCPTIRALDVEAPHTGEKP
jgi:hypothetical protein